MDYRVGDLRRLGVDGPFDDVVCWFTSFGYFDDADNRAVLAEFARVLKPGDGWPSRQCTTTGSSVSSPRPLCRTGLSG